MLDSLYRHYAQNAFDRSCKRGKRDTNVISRMRGFDNRALLLSQLLENVTIGGETHLGAQEVRVDRIVGTENRGDDFSRNFDPVKRWLASRWIAIYGLMTRSEFHEPISVIEVGGVLFVRDGHHRVSVAKALDKEFLPASVTRYNLPFRLPRNLDRNKLPLIRAKAQFHRNTGVFEILDESEFYVSCPKTWEWLEKEICEYNRAWFVRRFSREPKDLAEQVTTWYENLYHNAIDFIRRNSLTYLFPGKRETDIFVEMIRLWNSYDNPDGIWLGEIYNEFVAQHRRRRLLRSAMQAVTSALGSLVTSADEEYRQFAAISQVEEIVPDFRPLPKEKGFYRFLYRELVHRFAPALKPELGRAPYIHELTNRWHRDFYAPVAKYAASYPTAAQQTKFYMSFSRQHLRRIKDGSEEICAALREFASP
jgi:hypothetical protein